MRNRLITLAAIAGGVLLMGLTLLASSRPAECAGWGCAGGVCPCVYPCSCIGTETGPGVCVGPPR